MEFINQLIKEELHGLPFEGNGYFLVCKREEVDWLISAQSSKRDEREVTFNAGIYVPDLLNSYLRIPLHSGPEIGSCAVSVRIGMLNAAALDKWWRIDQLSKMSSDETDDLRKRFSGELLPFFRRFETVQSVANFLLSKRQRLDKFIMPQSDVLSALYGALALERAGDISAACVAMRIALEKSKNSPLERVVTQFTRNLSWFRISA